MSQFIEWLGNVSMIVGVVFMIIGVFGVFRFKDFYSRALITPKIDIVGFLFMMVGIMLKQGLNFFTAKILIILFFYIITNPIATHSIAKSAYRSGYRIKKERE